MNIPFDLLFMNGLSFDFWKWMDVCGGVGRAEMIHGPCDLPVCV